MAQGKTYVFQVVWCAGNPALGLLKDLAKGDRAHFMSRAAREIYMKLPQEDEAHEEDTEPMVAKCGQFREVCAAHKTPARHSKMTTSAQGRAH